jgi:hypothetical protein
MYPTLGSAAPVDTALHSLNLNSISTEISSILTPRLIESVGHIQLTIRDTTPTRGGFMEKFIYISHTKRLVTYTAA